MWTHNFINDKDMKIKIIYLVIYTDVFFVCVFIYFVFKQVDCTYGLRLCSCFSTQHNLKCISIEGRGAISFSPAGGGVAPQ